MVYTPVPVVCRIEAAHKAAVVIHTVAVHRVVVAVAHKVAGVIHSRAAVVAHRVVAVVAGSDRCTLGKYLSVPRIKYLLSVSPVIINVIHSYCKS